MTINNADIIFPSAACRAVSGVVKIDGPFRNDGTYGRRAAGWVALNAPMGAGPVQSLGTFSTRRDAIAAARAVFAA